MKEILSDGHWNLDYPIIRCLEENSDSLDLDEDSNAISVMVLVAGKLWCAVRDRIFVVCPNSLNVEVISLSPFASFIREMFSIRSWSTIVIDMSRALPRVVRRCTTCGSPLKVRTRFDSTTPHTSLRYWRPVFEQLSLRNFKVSLFSSLLSPDGFGVFPLVCDDIIRAHKLGCLHVTALHICKETLWVGTSAGVILNISLSQLIDSTSSNGGTKFASNSLQIKPLIFGHAGPVRLILSTDTNTSSTTSTVPTEEMKTLVLTIGDGFEDYNHNDETLGKDDAHSHLILWQI